MELQKILQHIIEECDSHEFKVEKEVARKHWRYLIRSLVISLVITLGGVIFISAIAGVLLKIFS